MNYEAMPRTRAAVDALTLPDVPAGAISWAAIVAGATAAAALSLILLILGTGLGLSSVSAWSGQGASGTTFAMSTILWLTFTQIAAAGMGGYLAGRLRSRWAGTHTDEVYFRDTAHGFLSWGLATIVTSGLLGTATSNIVGAGAQAGAAMAGGAATVSAAALPAIGDSGARLNVSSGSAYFVDSLFRRDGSAASTVPGDDAARSTAEANRIIVNGMSAGSLAADDTKYLGQIVAQRTGLTQADAEKRVTDTFMRMQAKAKEAEATAREAADKARKASAYGALWLFVSLLAGAFCASLAATFGGRRRDHV